MAAAIVAPIGPEVSASHAGPPETGRLSFGRAGAVVPSGFVGFSIEYSTLGRFLGLPGAPANPQFARTLTAIGAARPPQIRIGGDSADLTWPAGWPSPPAGVRYMASEAWFERLAAVVRASGASIVLTVNLAARRPDAAAELLRRAHAALPAGALAAVQIGNEPDRYTIDRVRLHDGTLRAFRPRGYGFADFLADERGELGALRATGIPFALTGPGFATAHWSAFDGRFLAAGLGVASYAAHVYPLSGCGHARGARHPIELLQRKATDRAVAYLAAARAAARTARVPLDVQEGNSISCTGVPGVSNHPYSALWAANLLFALTRAGVSRYHFHLSGGSYDAFAFHHSGRRWRVRLAPEYLGIVLFEHATAPGARLIPVSGAPRDVAAWATRSPSGVTRLLVVDRSPRRAARLLVPARAARVLSLTTTGAIRLGGRRVPRWLDNPRLDLRRLERTVTARSHVSVTLPPASAKVLTLR